MAFGTPIPGGVVQSTYPNQMASALPGQVYSASDSNLIDNCPVTDSNGVIAGRAAFSHIITAPLRAGISNIGADGIAGTLTAANFLGVVCRTMAGSLTTSAAGFAYNAVAPVLRPQRQGGRIWVESAGSLTGGAGTIAVTDPVYVVVGNLVTGNTAALLTFTNAAITGQGNTDTILIPGATFQSVCAATAGLPVVIEFSAAAATGSSQIMVAIGDPGAGQAIPVTQSGTVGLVTAAGLIAPEAARTLAAPTFAGQGMVISLKTKGTVGANGDTSVIVAAAFDGTHTTATFANQGDAVKLFSVASGVAFAWRLEVVIGATLS
jgi:hypothetical protein